MPGRKRLPDERKSVTHKFKIGLGTEDETEGFVTVGLYPDGSPGELYITLAKKGSALAAITDCWAWAISLLLQHGVPIDDIIAKAKGWRFEPAGRTANDAIPTALSVVDYIARWMEARFTGGASLPVRAGIFCPDCGGECAMQEGCEKCLACGWSKC